MAKTPIDQLKDYARGDTLLAADVNALIRAAKRQARITGQNAAGDEDFLAIGEGLSPLSLDMDLVYDIPIRHNVPNGAAIPPFGVLEPQSVDTTAVGQATMRHGYFVRKWDPSPAPNTRPWWVSTFLVNGPNEIPANTLSVLNRGLASTLHRGGWVAVSPVDDDGEDAVFTTSFDHSSVAQGRDNSFGPKPDSHLLWQGYNGFRVLSDKVLWPYGEDDYYVAYAVQVLPYREPRVFAAFAADGAIQLNVENNLQFTTKTYDGTQWWLNSVEVTSPLGMYVFESGTYELTMDGYLTPGGGNYDNATWTALVKFNFYDENDDVIAPEFVLPVSNLVLQQGDNPPELRNLKMPAHFAFTRWLRLRMNKLVQVKVMMTDVNVVWGTPFGYGGQAGADMQPAVAHLRKIEDYNYSHQ